jgi:hypothetical protein
MLIEAGQSVAIQFALCNSTGASSNADSTVTATLVLNGVDDATEVAVTNPATGVYKAAFTAGAWTLLDDIQVRIDFTMDTTISHGIVFNAVVGNVSNIDTILVDTNEIQGKLPAGGALMHAAGAAVAKSPATLDADDLSDAAASKIVDALFADVR